MWRCGVEVLTAAQLHSSLNSDSAQARTKLVACRKFTMMRISDNGPYWKKSLIVFCLSTTIPQKGRFNNYVTLKLPFLTHLSPIITLCHVCLRESSCVTSRSAQTIPPFPIKKEILKRGFKKDLKERNLFPLSYDFFSAKYQQHKKGNIFKEQNMSLWSFACPNRFYTI